MVVYTRKRVAKEALLPPASFRHFCGRASAVDSIGLSELLSLIDPNILVYLTRSDRLALAETRRGCRDAVEAYSRRNVQAIVANHSSYDDFLDEITAQSPIPTVRPKPLVLPYRYILYRAMSTDLYSLRELETTSPRWVKQVEVQGDRLVTMLDHGHLQVWNLATKECTLGIQYDQDNFYEHAVSRLILVQDRILYLQGPNVTSWNVETGEHDFTILLGDVENCGIVAIGRDRALILDDARGVQILDSIKGRVLEQAELSPWPAPFYGQNPWRKSNVFVCHDQWIVFYAWFDDAQGLFVFRLDNFQLFWHQSVAEDCDDYDVFLQSQDDPETFVAADSEIVDVFSFQNGTLTLRQSFPFSQDGDGGSLLAATASHVYVNVLLDEYTRRTINVYDIHTGSLVRCIDCTGYSAYDMALWGNEILLGRARMPTVAAYCFKEPEQLSS